MGKLVLFLKDATPVEIPLGKERVTIGRRADNDVCLPYPAVSAEHAAVVTILADSFLEDLGSTNGTLVNGRAVAKHFLRDRDQIDIGRQHLVYLADDTGKADAPAAVKAREDRRELGERVAPARPIAKASGAPGPIDEDLAAELRDPQGSVRSSPQAGSRPIAPESAGSGTFAETTEEEPPGFAPDFEAIRSARAESAGAIPPDPPDPEPERRIRARLQVLTGPSAGRVVPIARDEFVVGRVGVQVAAIVWRDDAWVLVPREGSHPPTVNGEPVASEGRTLAPGDGFEVAGTRLELLPAG